MIKEYHYANITHLESLISGDEINILNLQNLNITTIPEHTFEDTNIKSIILPKKLKIIEERSFTNCSIESIIVPNSVTSIGSYAFKKCDSLKSITLPFIGTSLDSEEVFGSIFGSSNRGAIPDSLREVIITGGTFVTGVAFMNSFYVTSIILPSSITSIGNHAFEGCYSLPKIEIPKRVTSIGRKAFYNCTNLNSLIFLGTMAEWNAIEKGNDWNSQVPATYVQCSDGQVTL